MKSSQSKFSNERSCSGVSASGSKHSSGCGCGSKISDSMDNAENSSSTEK